MVDFGPELEVLRAALERHEVLVFIGSGVSAAASGGAATATWEGLLLDGVNFIQRVNPLKDSDSMRAQLSAASGVDDYLDVADDVTEALGGVESQKFRRWLAESVGALRPTAEGMRLLRAIINLGNPLATTNYDHLLEWASGYPAYSWREAALVKEVIQNRRLGIAHLHGHVDRPSEVVLTRRGYQELLTAKEFLEQRQPLAHFRTFLYIGFGEGLNDPNFKRWRDASGLLVPALIEPSFRLCLDSQWKSLVREHRSDPSIYCIPYGPKYEDLTEFLNRLAPESLPVGRARVVVHEPMDRDNCSHTVAMSGTVEGLSPGLDLWIVKEVGPGNFHPDDGPVYTMRGQWFGTAYLGAQNATVSTPRSYTVHIVLASRSTSTYYRQYLDRCHAADSWPGLPTLMGAVPVCTVTLTRRFT